MLEALKVAQAAEKAEEEEMMKRALEASQQLENESKAKEDEEMEKMIQQAIEMSKKEEEEKKAKEDKEQKEALKKVAEVEEVKAEPEPVAPQEVEQPITTTEGAPKELIEIKAAGGPSEAELRKMEELRKLKEQNKLKKEKKKDTADDALPKIKAPALPPVSMQRRGQFEMIPDFLNKKEVNKDMSSLNEMDLMQEALDKQQKKNEESGLSMAELFEQKRKAAEKKLEEAKTKPDGPSKSDIEDRKARLLAQRDLLRKQKE